MWEIRSYTWGTSRDCGFSGAFLGSSDRFAQIHKKKDDKHRDWQRVILLKMVNKLIRTQNEDIAQPDDVSDDHIVATRDVLEKLENKMMEQPEYAKMLLLVQLKTQLRELDGDGKNELSVGEYGTIVDDLYWAAEGKVVEPFLPLKEYARLAGLDGGADSGDTDSVPTAMAAK